MPDASYRGFLYHILHERLKFLATRVVFLRKRQPETYRQHTHTKLLLAVWKVINESLVAPDSPRYFLGNTLGQQHRNWRRCKEGLPPRYRLFFRFSSEQSVCVYAWLNDEKTLRKEGSKSDVYTEFKRYLESGEIPTSLVDALRHSVSWEAVEQTLKSVSS